jgi:hypothetical protein
MSTPNPLPLPTVKQVVETAAAQGHSVDEVFGAQATTTDMNTSKGQINVPSVTGSQPSSNKPLATQFQGTQIESASMEDGFTRPLTEDEILRMPGLEARSFNYSGDEVKVLPVNHNYVLRWVQCGDYRGAGTNWLAKTIARGFTYVVEADLMPEFREKFKKDALGHFVIPPDLVLLKCESRLYYGYIKSNMLESLDRVSDKGALTRAQKIAAQQMRGDALPGELKDPSKAIGGAEASPVKNFGNNLNKDKAQFYDPLAGR